MNWGMVLAVAAGGAVGSVVRYGAMVWVGRWLGTGFPWGTLFVNVVGSFLMGVLMETLALRLNVSQEVRGVIAVGFLGGLTTFSTFSLDAAVLIQRGAWEPALLYICSSIVLGLAALFAAAALMRTVLTV